MNFSCTSHKLGPPKTFKHACINIPWRHTAVFPACWMYSCKSHLRRTSVSTSKRKCKLTFVQYSLDYGSDGPEPVGLLFGWPHLAMQDYMTFQRDWACSCMRRIPVQPCQCFGHAWSLILWNRVAWRDWKPIVIVLDTLQTCWSVISGL